MISCHELITECRCVRLGRVVLVVMVEYGRFVELEKLGEKGTRVWNWKGKAILLGRDKGRDSKKLDWMKVLLFRFFQRANLP